MALQIIDADQPITVDAIIAVMFGMPDAGKTSLAQTAEGTFLLDFDEGLQRSVKRKRAAFIAQWEEVVDFYQSNQIEELGIKTLIIDTAGTMLDNYISAAVIRSDPKNAKRDGSLGLSGYGAMKNVFNQFVNAMKAKKIDVIFIAHDADAEEDGYNRKVPKVTGGSYDILKGKADIMGYLYIQNGKRLLDFNRTDFHDGKNCAEFDKMEVPHYTDDEKYDNFFANIIQATKDKMNKMSEEMVNAQQKVDQCRKLINDTSDLDELISLQGSLFDGLNLTYTVQVSKLYEDKFFEYLDLWLEGVDSEKGMDEFLKFASTQDVKFVPRLKGITNTKLKELGFIYDKELKKVVSVPKAENAENSATEAAKIPTESEATKAENEKPKAAGKTSAQKAMDL